MERKEKANNVNRIMKTKCIEFYLQRVIFCSKKIFYTQLSAVKKAEEGRTKRKRKQKQQK